VDPLMARYVAENQALAKDLLDSMKNVGLLYERFDNEDAEYCRRSADRLRYSFENDKSAVRNEGPLHKAIDDMESACRRFVRIGGPNAINHMSDRDLFVHNLNTLRRIFGQRLGLIVEMFALTPSPEVQRLIDATH
jgi:hypothetical protein